MHAVRRPSLYGISTLSISAPSSHRHSRFRVPSPLTRSCEISIVPHAASALSCARKFFGRLAIASKSVTPFSYIHSCSCFARNLGWL